MAFWIFPYTAQMLIANIKLFEGEGTICKSLQIRLVLTASPNFIHQVCVGLTDPSDAIQAKTVVTTIADSMLQKLETNVPKRLHITPSLMIVWKVEMTLFKHSVLRYQSIKLLPVQKTVNGSYVKITD